MIRKISRILFEILNALLILFFALCVWSFSTGGFSFALLGIEIRLHRLDNIFLFIVGIGLFKFFFDPSWNSVRGYFKSFQNLFWWGALLLGALSTGLFLWFYEDPFHVIHLLALGELPYDERIELRKYLKYFVLLFHFVWIFFSKRLSKYNPTLLHWILMKDAQILSLGVFLPVFFIFLGQGVPNENQEWPFFIWVIFLSLGMTFKGALWVKVHSGQEPKSINFRQILFFLIFLYVGVFSLLGVRKLDLYLGNSDFPVYLQPLWNTLHGHLMQINWVYTPPGESMSWFGEHFDLIYFFLLPIYWIFQNARVFIFLQALLIGFAAWPLFEIAKLKLKNQTWAFLFAFAYLANPLISRALLFDFHAEAAEPLLIFSTFLFLEKRRPGLFLISGVLLLFCKEDASLYLMAFGLYAIFFKKNWRFGIASLCLGVFWLLFALGFAIPIFNGGIRYHTFAARYPQLGADFKTIVLNVIQHPLLILKFLFDEQSIKNWGYLLIPLAALPLLHWTSWLLILPSTLELFLSQFRPMKGLALHYPWFICPFYFLGAILSLRRLMNQYVIFKSPIFMRGLMFYLFFAGIFFHYYFDPKPALSHTYNWYFVSPSPLGKNFDVEYYRLNDHDRKAKEFIRQRIPKEESLSGVHRFSHDLFDRFVLRMFPDAQDTKFIFLDIFWDQAWALSQIDFKKFKERIFLYLEERKFGVREYDDGYVLLERGFSTSKNLKVAQDLIEFFEAELMGHRVGKTVVDHQAYNKRARLVVSGEFPAGYVLYGTGQNFPKGPLEVTVRLRAQSRRKEGTVCRIQLSRESSNEILLEQAVRVQDVTQSKGYQDITMRYDNPEAQPLAVQVFYEGQDDLWIDHFRWVCPGLSWSDLERNLEV